MSVFVHKSACQIERKRADKNSGTFAAGRKRANKNSGTFAAAAPLRNWSSTFAITSAVT